jgi:hypothetical protein
MRENVEYRLLEEFERRRRENAEPEDVPLQWLERLRVRREHEEREAAPRASALDLRD